MESLFSEIEFDNREANDLSVVNHSPKFYADVLERWINGDVVKPEELQVLVNVLILNPKYQLPDQKVPELIDLIRDALIQPFLQDSGNLLKGLYLYSLFYLLLKYGIKHEALSVLRELDISLMRYHIPGKSILPQPNDPSPFTFNIYTEEQKSQDKSDQVKDAYSEIILRILEEKELISLEPDFNLNKLPLPVSTLSAQECFEMRANALYYYENKEYFKALNIYSLMLITRFEIPGTLTHIARVEFCLGQIDRAEKYIELAWRHREEAPSYVIARILWFKLSFSVLKSLNEEIPEILARLKAILQNQEAFMNWTMEPVLKELKPLLKKNDHNFLSTLADAISFRENFEQLDNYPEWKNTKPIPFRKK